MPNRKKELYSIIFCFICKDFHIEYRYYKIFSSTTKKNQNEIISSTGKLISNTTVDSETIGPVLQGIGYVLIWGADDSERDELKGSIDAFLDPIFDMAENGETSSDHVWLTNNALYYTGKWGSYYSDPDKANDILTKAMKTYKKWSEPYFTAAQQIAKAYGEDANGKRIDLEEMVKDGKNGRFAKISLPSK
ncbi:hypothetical protein [Brevibacillus formosus]|uniref:hypothetical protein n=1 Tax=Brevibacillus formosus TaxID=54913 RepID=UPI003F19D299